MDSYSNSYCLLCPGPVNVHPEVAKALTEYAFCHREEEFSVLLEETCRNALDVAGIRHHEDYSAMIVTGSGTAGNESVLSSVVPEGGRVVVLCSGEFGQRLAKISKVYNENTTVIEHEWGAPFDLDALERELSGSKVHLVAMVHHETSTGILNPVNEVGELCNRYGVKLFVDAVSSYSADVLELEKAHVSFMTTSSGKAIGAFPGLALVIARRDALEALASLPVRNHYLNLYRHFQFAEDKAQTPNTPAVPLIMALNRALELAKREGLEQRRERLANLADYVRRHLERRGLSFTSQEMPRSVVLTNVEIPNHMSFETLRHALREYGFVIYGGKGPLSDKVFQISTISHLSFNDIDRFFDCFDEIRGALTEAA